jgi:hypothetical protein
MSDDSEAVRATSRWQRRLLPFMVLMIAGLTIFFVYGTYSQLNRVSSQITESPMLDLAPALDERALEQDWKARVILEGNALERRYHQANVLLLSRVWLRYMGFLTGMIIGLTGATFILGKLSEPESRVAGEAAAMKFSIATASPGLVLVLLGTVLMITTVVTNPAIEVKDSRTYLGEKDAPASEVSGQPP